MEIVKIKTSLLEANTGQVWGLPSNPRQWTKDELRRLAASLLETPELFEARPCLVYPHEGKYIVLGGNFRLAASKENKAKEVPCIVFPADTPVDKLKQIVIKDNGAFGSWDFDALANEWDDLPLTDWGVPVWETEKVEQGGRKETALGFEFDEKGTNEEAELLLREAMKNSVKENLQQIDYLMQRGWLHSSMTEGWAQAQFLRAKYYGIRMPSYVSYYFCPERFYTSANKISVYEQLKRVASGETEAGISGFRTATDDGLLLLLLLKGSYPIVGSRLPMDFPSDLARDLIREFGGEGCSVLDPCHGWGGRYVGALLAGAAHYVGVDPSEEAHRGLVRMERAFGGFCPLSSAEFVLSPFEDYDVQEAGFDMAITSPPYFDVEQYHGDFQAHIRYPKYELWREKFYRPLFEKVHKGLIAGGYFVLNVGSQSYPLIEDGLRVAEETRFDVIEVRPFGRGTSSNLHGNDDETEENEKIIILQAL